MLDNRDVDRVRPILRLKSFEEFNNIPPELAVEIEAKLGVKWEPENFDIRIIGEDEKYAHHFKARVDALNEGINHLFAQELPQYKYNGALKNYLTALATDCKEQMDKADGTYISVYQNSLANYTDFILQTLQTELNLSKKEAMHIWSRAEQFALAKKTKPAVCTIVTSADNDYMAMIDQPQNPFSDAIKAELEQIKSAIDVHDENLPKWFYELSDNEKNDIKNFLAEVDLGNDLGTTINALSSKLRTIPVPSNYGMHSFITCSQNEKTNQMETTVHTDIHRSSHTASRDVASKSQEVRDTHTERNIQKEIDDAEGKVTADILSKINKLYDRYKSGVAGAELEWQTFLASMTKREDGITPVIVVPILYQTLVSPSREPDKSLNKDKERAIKNIRETLNNKVTKTDSGIEIHYRLTATNHPLNYGKYLNPTTRASKTGIRVELLSNRIKKYPNPFLSENQKKLLNVAAQKLRKETRSFSRLLHSYRELYLSSLEQIVVELQGGASIGSCISGKDRKAIELAHTDAMKHYFNRYKMLPSMSDPDPNFSALFAEIYCSKHQQMLAGQNSPGADGTKTPDMYLPKHLKDAVNEWYAKKVDVKQIQENIQNYQNYQHTAGKDILKESDRLASNNDIKSIKKLKVPPAKADQVWQAPLSLDRRELYFKDDKAMEKLITDALTAIEKYKHPNHDQTRLDRMGFFSRTFDADRGKLRAEAYHSLLTTMGLHLEQKFFLLGALILSNDGKHLQDEVYKAMGFSSLDSARNTFKHYFNWYAEEENRARARDRARDGVKETVQETREKVGGTIQAVLGKMNTITKLEKQAEKEGAVMDILNIEFKSPWAKAPQNTPKKNF